MTAAADGGRAGPVTPTPEQTEEMLAMQGIKAMIDSDPALKAEVDEFHALSSSSAQARLGIFEQLGIDASSPTPGADPTGLLTMIFGV